MPAGKAYVDLIVSFEGANEEDIPGPPVRYFTGSWPLVKLDLHITENQCLSTENLFFNFAATLSKCLHQTYPDFPPSQSVVEDEAWCSLLL